MSPLEIALVTLVSVWTVLFSALGVAGVYLLRDFRRILSRLDGILRSFQDSSADARAGLDALVAAVRGVFATPAAPAHQSRTAPGFPHPNLENPGVRAALRPEKRPRTTCGSSQEPRGSGSRK